MNGKCRSSKIINEYNGGFPFTTEDIVETNQEKGEETGSTNQEWAHRGLKIKQDQTEDGDYLEEKYKLK